MKNVYDNDIHLFDYGLKEANFAMFKDSIDVGDKLNAIKFLNLSNNQISSLKGIDTL